MSGIDTRQYLQLFVSEAGEAITGLNEALLRLETYPNDAESISEVFRLAHSLKGSAGTMGYERLEALTHEMEAVLDEIRGGNREVDARTVSVLLKCCDVLESGIAAVSESGEDACDVTSSIDMLRSLTDAPLHQPTAAVLDVVVTVDESCEAPSLRLFMALQALEAVGSVESSTPTADDVVTSDAVVLTARLTSSIPIQEIEQTLDRVSEITFTVNEATQTADEAPQATSSGAVAAPSSASAASGPAKRAVAKTVRVESDRLDQLMHVMGEVIVHRTSVELFINESNLKAAAGAMQELRRASQALQNVVMNVRMVSIEASLTRIPRLVRDLAGDLGKDVHLEMLGTDTEIDRSVVDALSEPIIHLVRNALDHGIEPTDERQELGKSLTAKLMIRARHAGGNVAITVRDDGRGIDPHAVAARAVERGLISTEEANAVTMASAIELLFAPGFSTAREATNISGRGVGMDAVRSMCQKWGGSVHMTSTTGVGSEVEILIPLSLAIMTVLIVESGGQRLALPIDRVNRTVHLKDYHVVDSGSARVLELDGGVVSVINLGESLGFATDEVERFGVIVNLGGGRKVVLTVGGLIGEHETVIKSLPKSATSGMRFMGSFVMSDGSVVLIANCDVLVREATADRQTAELVG